MISHSIPSQDSALMNTPNMANADSNCPTEQEREREKPWLGLVMYLRRSGR